MPCAVRLAVVDRLGGLRGAWIDGELDGWSWCSVSQSPSTAAKRSGCSTWGRCPQSGSSDSRPSRQEVDRGLGLVGGQHVVAAAPDDQGGRGEGGELVEQDLALPGGAEQGAGHGGGGFELAGAASEGVLLGEEVGGCPPGLGEQHRGGHGGAAQVATGQAAEHDRQLADEGQGVHGEQGVHLAAEPGAVDQGQGPDRGPGRRGPAAAASAPPAECPTTCSGDRRRGCRGTRRRTGRCRCRGRRRRACAVSPWPGRLRASTRWVRARAGMTHRQLVALCSCPCSSRSVGPVPASRYWV